MASSLTAEVAGLLRSGDASWDAVPKQGEFDRDRMLGRITKIHQAFTQVAGNSLAAQADQALEQTVSFVTQAFDVYEGKVEGEKYDWAFAVPARVEGYQDSYQGDEYASEVTPFLPLLDAKFGVDARTRQYTIAQLAPAVIDSYRGTADGRRGAIVWTPFFVDADARSSTDSWRAFVKHQALPIRDSINKTAGFVRGTLGASVMGLGASIPSFTRLGKSINIEGLTPTTGHAGTTYLIAETVNNVSERLGDGKRVGILGVGSIGSSTAEILLEQDAGYHLSLYDRDESQTRRFIELVDKEAGSDVSNRLDVIADEIALLRSANIIVAATNASIDLDALEESSGERIDLSGVVIIDDSQPGCFERSQVEERGGKLVWVVGQDNSSQKVLERLGGYSFGSSVGLYGPGSIWGCEAEVAAIYLNNRSEFAVRGHVTPEQATAIGGLCKSINIRVAEPFQSFGKPVELI